MHGVMGTIRPSKWGPETDKLLRELYDSGMHLAEIAVKMNRTKAAIETRAARLELRRPERKVTMRRPAPLDIAEVAARMSRNEMARHYYVSRETIVRWINETGVECLDLKKRGIPAEFASVVPLHTKAELIEMFDKEASTIDRWLRVCAVRPKKVLSAPKRRIEELEQEKTRPPEIKWFPQKVKSQAPVAADFLRKHYPAVFRCDIKLWEARQGTWGSQRNLPDYGRNQYFVSGKGTLWIDELVELARSHGFSGEEAA